MKTVITNALLDNGKKVDIIIEKEFIKTIKESCNNKYTKNYKIINANGNIVLPGMIDIHVHMRDFNQSHKETHETGQKACIENGITCYFDMPNSIPNVTNLKSVLDKEKKMSKNIIDSYQYIGLNKNSKYEEIIKCLKYAKGIKIFLNETTGNMEFDLSKLDERIFELDTVYLFHAEDDRILDIKNIIKNKKTKIHICHISTEKEYNNVQKLKKHFNNITYEFTPHHLFLSSLKKPKMLEYVKPSLKNKKEQKKLLKIFSKDSNAILATDHAPHLLEEKFEKKTYGFAGIDTSLKVLLTLAKKKKISYKKISDSYSRLPATLMGLYKVGEIREGFYANLIIVDKNYKEKIKNEKIISKCKWTIFENVKLYGKVVATIFHGKLLKGGKNEK